MNPRIFKKLCKRAAPYIAATRNDLFPSSDNKGDLCNSIRVEDKYLCRSPLLREHRYFLLLGNTKGFAWSCSYEYPDEYEFEYAYNLLINAIIDHFTDWESFDIDAGEWPKAAIKIYGPSDVFKFADQMMSELKEAA